jgi:hypothetical protein
MTPSRVDCPWFLVSDGKKQAFRHAIARGLSKVSCRIRDACLNAIENMLKHVHVHLRFLFENPLKLDFFNII